MQASQYPITTDFGWIKGYPLNIDPTTGLGFHRGQDRFMPVGTPVFVNGVEIGLSGATGDVTGPHLHIGKFIGGSAVNPNGQGFNLSSPFVYDTGFDSTDGNYIRLQDSAGVMWVYLHLSQTLVSKAQILEGVIAMPSEAEVKSVFQTYAVGTPSVKQIKDYTSSPWTRLLDDILHFVSDREKAELASLTAALSAAKVGATTKDSALAYVTANLK